MEHIASHTPSVNRDLVLSHLIFLFLDKAILKSELNPPALAFQVLGLQA